MIKVKFDLNLKYEESVWSQRISPYVQKLLSFKAQESEHGRRGWPAQRNFPDVQKSKQKQWIQGKRCIRVDNEAIVSSQQEALIWTK